MNVEMLLHETDRYLNGEMSGEEKERFEKRRNEDAVLDQQVVEQAYFRNMLRYYGDRRKLQQQVEDLYARPAAGIRKETIANAAAPLIIPFRRYIWKTAAVAAGIALMVASGTVWLSHDFSRSNSSTQYRELKRDMDNIKRSQTAIMNDMKSSRAPVNPGTFGGTGFAISSNGYLATNFHVIENADSIYVQNNKGDVFKVKLVYQDRAADLAVLKILDSSFSLPALPYSLQPVPAAIGEKVYTLGYPKDDIVYGEGYISAETGYRSDTSAYQIALTVNPGNSGGPLLDHKGNVVGIVSGKQTPSDDIAFAIKSAYLKSMFDSLPDDFSRRSLLNKPNNLQHLDRVDQIKKLENYVFIVKVYN